MTAKTMQARFPSKCSLCGRQIRAGEWITWSREQGANCTTPTTTIGSDGRAYYGHTAEHPAIVTTTVEPEHPGVTRTTYRVESIRTTPTGARWCRNCNDWEHNSCSGECRMYA